eukprot:1195664-Prorocentrum_minimum.AAC.9
MASRTLTNQQGRHIDAGSDLASVEGLKDAKNRLMSSYSFAVVGTLDDSHPAVSMPPGTTKSLRVT